MTYLFRTHKQQVLYCVCHAWHIILVGEITHIDVDGGTSLIGIGIVHQKSLELVGQTNDAIGPIIELRSLQVFCDALNLSHGGGFCGGERVGGSKGTGPDVLG